MKLLTCFHSQALLLSAVLLATPLVISAAENHSFRTSGQVEQGTFQTEKRLQSVETSIVLIEKDFSVLKEITSTSQRNIEWWISFLSIFLAVVGIGIPYLIGLKLRQEYRTAVQDAENAATESKGYLAEIAKNRDRSQEDSDEIRRKRRELLEEISIPLSKEETTSSDIKLPNAPVIAEVLGDPNSPDRDRLRAAALSFEQEEKWQDAATLWQALSFLEINNPDPFIRYATALERLAETVGNPEREAELLEIAISAATRALEINPAHAHALRNLAHYQYLLADYEKSSERKRDLLNRALSNFRSSVEFEPTLAAYVLWGRTLEEVANLPDMQSDTRKLLDEARSKFEMALSINPDSDWALTSLAVLLLKIVPHVESQNEKRQLTIDSVEKLKRAVDLDSTEFFPLISLANSLSKLVTLSTSEAEKKALLIDTIEFCAKAHAIESGGGFVHNLWARAIWELADLEDSNNEKERLLNEAISLIETLPDAAEQPILNALKQALADLAKDGS